MLTLSLFLLATTARLVRGFTEIPSGCSPTETVPMTVRPARSTTVTVLSFSLATTAVPADRSTATPEGPSPVWRVVAWTDDADRREQMNARTQKRANLMNESRGLICIFGREVLTELLPYHTTHQLLPYVAEQVSPAGGGACRITTTTTHHKRFQLYFRTGMSTHNNMTRNTRQVLLSHLQGRESLLQNRLPPTLL